MSAKKINAIEVSVLATLLGDVERACAFRGSCVVQLRHVVVTINGKPAKLYRDKYGTMTLATLLRRAVTP